MGVTGLKTFIESNQDLLIDHRLQNTKIIIDGNNFYHFLYRSTSKFGIDYNGYVRLVQKYFDCFRTCNIEAIVLMDGAYPPDNSKLKIHKQRAKNRTQKVASILYKNSDVQVTPILARDVFCSVIEKCNVTHITCDFEADKQIVALANHFQCPVMSNDSDFFIYDITGGLILSDQTNFHVCLIDNGQYYLKTKICFFSKFLTSFPGLKKELVPLYSSLLANDFINKHHLKLFDFQNQYRTKFLSLLHWLEYKDSVDEALSKISQCFYSNERDNMIKTIKQSIEEYQAVTNPSTLTMSALINDSELKTPQGGAYPKWFLDKIRKDCIFCLNVISTQKDRLPVHVENLEEASAYRCGENLRRVLYGVVLEVEEMKQVVETTVKYTHSIHGGQVDFIDNTIHLNPTDGIRLTDIEHMDISRRRDQILQWLSTPEDVYKKFADVVDESMVLPLLTAQYWIDNAAPILEKLHVKCFLINHIYSICSRKEYKDRFFAEESEMFLHSTKKFKDGRPHMFENVEFVHADAQYQSCLQAVLALNQVMMCPFEVPDISLFLFGTFMVNMYHELKGQLDPDVFIEDLWGNDRELSLYYNKLLGIFSLHEIS